MRGQSRPKFMRMRHLFRSIAAVAAVLLVPLLSVAWTTLSAAATAAETNSSTQQQVGIDPNDTATPWSEHGRPHLGTLEAPGLRRETDCFPMPPVKPSTPGPIPVPLAEPRVPESIPMPRVAPQCGNGESLTKLAPRPRRQ